MADIGEADLANIHELIERSELLSIECYEVHARRRDVTGTDDPDVDAQLSINVQNRLDDDSFGIRLVASTTMQIGDASASVAGEYALLDGYRPSQRTLQMFINEVGVMTVFPYLREAIATTTARVFGEPLLLPTVQRGEICVDVDED